MNGFKDLKTLSLMIKNRAKELSVFANDTDASAEIKALHKLFVDMHAITPTTELYVLSLLNNKTKAKQVQVDFFKMVNTEVTTPAQKQVSDVLKTFLDEVLMSLPEFYESLSRTAKNAILALPAIEERIIGIKVDLIENLINYNEPSTDVETASVNTDSPLSVTELNQDSTTNTNETVAAINVSPIETSIPEPAMPTDALNTDHTLASPKVTASQNNILQRAADRTGPTRHKVTKDSSGTIVAATTDQSVLKRSKGETGPKRYKLTKEHGVIKSADLIETPKPVAEDKKLIALHEKAGGLFTQYYQAYIAANKASWNPLHGKTGRDNATQVHEQFMALIKNLDVSLTHDQQIEQMISAVNGMHKIYNVSGNRTHSFKNYLNKFKQELEALKESKTASNAASPSTSSTATAFLTRYLCLGQSKAVNPTATPNS